MKYLTVCMGAVLFSAQLLAQEGSAPASPQDQAEALQQIDTLRAQKMAELDGREAACYARFAVSGCLKSVQSERRAVLARLRRQEAELHEQQLQQQAAEKRLQAQTRLQERAQQDADRLAQNPGAAADEKLQAQKQKQADHQARAAQTPASAAPASPAGPTAAEQAANRASYASKQQEAQKKREEIARRLSEKNGKGAAPLPVAP